MLNLNKKDVTSKDKQISKKASTFYEGLEDPINLLYFIFIFVIVLSILFYLVAPAIKQVLMLA